MGAINTGICRASPTGACPGGGQETGEGMGWMGKGEREIDVNEGKGEQQG